MDGSPPVMLAATRSLLSLSLPFDQLSANSYHSISGLQYKILAVAGHTLERVAGISFQTINKQWPGEEGFEHQDEGPVVGPLFRWNTH